MTTVLIRRPWRRAPLTYDQLDAAADRGRKALHKRPDYIVELERRGRERALIYKTLVLTGLRKSELASLTVGHLELGGPVAYAVLDAADEKAGRGAEIPLRADLVRDLSGMAGREAGSRQSGRKAGCLGFCTAPAVARNSAVQRTSGLGADA